MVRASFLRIARESRVGAWRSLVAHLTGGQGVAGSNPVAPTISIPEMIEPCTRDFNHGACAI